MGEETHQEARPRPSLLPPAFLPRLWAAEGKRILGWVAGVLGLQGTSGGWGGRTMVSNNSLCACNKLTPQREGRGLAGEAGEEDADLDRLGWRQRLASSERVAYTWRDLPPPRLPRPADNT